MIGSRRVVGRTAAQREVMRRLYELHVGPLRLFLLLECAPLTIDPLDVADQAFFRVFDERGEAFGFCDLRKAAEGIVNALKESGVAHSYAEYRLEDVFDPYLTEDLEPVRRALRAIDLLSLAERRAVEAECLHLLTMDGLTQTVGGAASTRRVQKAKGLAKLAAQEVNLDVLKPFFMQMGRNAQ
ncbi:hypothetical protein [Streptomyces sp. NPDC059466]|uniref:hypothetical protein n=1 Tax=unclassified Streptomyces TaxID=2593676 RepID=UPI00368136C1